MLQSMCFTLLPFSWFAALVAGALDDLAAASERELEAMPAEEARHMEIVQLIVCMAVCDVLAALLTPRADRLGTPIDPDLGHVC